MPVFFRQYRSGINGKSFLLFKFRTLIPSDKSNYLLTDSSRSYPLGNILRTLSLDELPSFINVLRGDMSFIGPRPLLPSYNSKYSSVHAQRLLVLPGLTGLAQVSGRRTLTFSKRFDLDVLYVNRLSFFLDIFILFKTPFALFDFSNNQNNQSPLHLDDLGLWS